MNESKTPQLAARLSLRQIKSLAAEQARAHEEIIIRQERASKAEIAIDQDLREEVRADRARKIRDRELSHGEELATEMRDRAVQAESQLRHWTPEAARRRAVFSQKPEEDATIRMAWMQRVEKEPPDELLEVARDAAGEQNLALGATVLLEAQSRKDLPKQIAQEVAGLVQSIPTPEVDEPAALLRRVVALHQDAYRVRVDMSTGRVDMTRKLAVARVMATPDEGSQEESNANRLSGRAASA